MVRAAAAGKAFGMRGFSAIVVALCLITAAASADAGEPVACETCHADLAISLTTTPHGASHGDGGVACEQCHRDAAAHAAAPPAPHGMLTFRDDDAEATDRACGTCHDANTHPAGVHRRAGVACTDCHGVHEPLTQPLALPGFERVDRASASCQGCHQDVFTRFSFNESHRIAQGSVGCTSCHDPHQVDTRRHLGGFKSAPCADCHADADGPFVFEHAASRVEGCTACHDPHGSPNRRLLTHQSVGELCYSCHTVMPAFHFGFVPGAPPRFDLNTVCTNCHVTIHGSNLDRNFLR